MPKTKKDDLPRHIAIIMDGNGRWAQKRGLPRIMGHRAGIKVARRVIKDCIDLGIEVLTLYTFSCENWKRPKKEVDFLMRLLRQYLKQQKNMILKNNICFRALGRLEELPGQIRKQLYQLMEVTENNNGLKLNLALNYGGRPEIIDATRKIACEIQKRKLQPHQINEELFQNYLYTTGLPDPDLLIRTGGEFRISNFLLWQISYSEIYITKKLWPDFQKDDLEKALISYQRRERRFGGVIS